MMGQCMLVLQDLERTKSKMDVIGNNIANVNTVGYKKVL